MRKAKSLLIVVLLALLACLSICTVQGQPSGNAVQIKDFSYEPSQLTVSAGTTVTWTNYGSTPHTVTSDDGKFNSGNIAPGAQYSYTFAQPGSYPYHCTIHPSMKGTITVTSETAASAATSAANIMATNALLVPGTSQVDISQYSQYYKMTGSAAPTTPVTTPEKIDITGKEPTTLYFSGQENAIPYSQYQTYATYTSGNSLWIEGATSWTQYAMAPQGSSLSLIAITPTGGNGVLYEIYPSGKLSLYNLYFYPYNRIGFYADEIGQHILLFMLNNQPSNAVVIDVVSYYPTSGGYQQPLGYQQSSNYQSSQTYQPPSGYPQTGGYQQTSSYQSSYQQSANSGSSGGY